MIILKKIFSYFYYIYFAILFVCFCFLLGPFVFLRVRGQNKCKRAKRIKTFWSKWMMFLMGIRVKVEGLDKIDFSKNYIICPNHKSDLDIILMYLIIPQDFAFIGKSELLKWPVIRFFFKRGVDIPVFRDSVSKAAKCLVQAKAEIEKSRSIVIFPEGGWDNSETEMRRFKSGAFQLAIDTGLSVLPLTFKNNYQLFTDYSDFSGNSKPGIARVVVHQPINVDSLSRKDLVSLKNKTFNIIQQELTSEN